RALPRADRQQEGAVLPVNTPELPLFRDLGTDVPYEPTWRKMQALTAERDDDTPDEIWFLQHPPVFTMGLNGKPEHVLAAGDIPVVNIDRGGQVTYHGPGQLVVYPMVNLRRRGLGVRALVEALENAVIDTLQDFGIEARSRRDAPGVYTPDGAKIDRKSTRLNSSHVKISYAVFRLKKKKTTTVCNQRNSNID